MVKTITNSKSSRNARQSTLKNMTKYIGLLVNKKRKANIRAKHPWSETVKNKDMTSRHKKYTPTQVEVKIMTQVIEYIHNYIPWLKLREPLEIIELVI